MNVLLNDDVLGTVGDTKTLSSDDTLASNSNNGLVGPEINRADTSLVISDADRLDTCTCVAVGTPFGVVDSILSAVSRALVGCWSAASLSDGAFGTDEAVSMRKTLVS